ncbi:uncharacterized protein LOC142564799 [Dermacentor variabilis]|uniref:uncharacterized protein LOC142564799 n=1 Tax=Dermacentor variabilis TaxID=34621 RepID=UPI003F5C9B01
MDAYRSSRSAFALTATVTVFCTAVWSCYYDDCTNGTRACIEKLRLEVDSVTCALNVTLRGKLTCDAPAAMCQNATLMKRELYVALWWLGSKKFQETCSFRPVFYQWMLPCWLKLVPPREDEPYLLRG